MVKTKHRVSMIRKVYSALEKKLGSFEDTDNDEVVEVLATVMETFVTEKHPEDINTVLIGFAFWANDCDVRKYDDWVMENRLTSVALIAYHATWEFDMAMRRKARESKHGKSAA